MNSTTKKYFLQKFYTSWQRDLILQDFSVQVKKTSVAVHRITSKGPGFFFILFILFYINTDFSVFLAVEETFKSKTELTFRLHLSL